MLRRVCAATAVPLLVVLSGLWAHYLSAHGSRLLLGAAPFFGHVEPRVGVGTPLAVLLALAVVAWGPALAHSLSWQVLPWATSAAAACWALALALVDGTRGITHPLSVRDEYLHELPRVHDLGAFLSSFVSHINGSDAWVTHVAGHPPGMLLVLAGLREIGFGGSWPAALLCVLVGSSSAAAVLLTMRRLVDENSARTAAAYLVLLPAAVWVAVSADAFFLGVSAWGIALLACRGLVRPLLGGLMLGAALMLSYGLVTLGVLALVVLLINRRLGAVAVASVGVLAVLGLFAALGFNWYDGLQATVIRYRAGAGGYRPYGYFVVSNLIVLGAAVGPATAAGVTALDKRDRLSWLVGAALVGVLLADVSGKAKAEVERIWLFFTPWLAIAASRLDRPRVWLGLQALSGLLIQSVLYSNW